MNLTDHQAALLETAHAQDIHAARLNPLQWSVRSRSRPGDSHVVTFDPASGFWVSCSGVDGDVECRGYAHHGYCRHCLIAYEARELWVASTSLTALLDRSIVEAQARKEQERLDREAEVRKAAQMKRLFGPHPNLSVVQ